MTLLIPNLSSKLGFLLIMDSWILAWGDEYQIMHWDRIKLLLSWTAFGSPFQWKLLDCLFPEEKTIQNLNGMKQWYSELKCQYCETRVLKDMVIIPEIHLVSNVPGGRFNIKTTRRQSPIFIMHQMHGKVEDLISKLRWGASVASWIHLPFCLYVTL